ncbi:MAG: NYN domain-containing protein [Pseudomonadota bacterium]|nr:NYN domain-containing protein [Pseudomonadota bacterium]
MTRRAIVYIDGFNLYHAVDNLKRPHLKWLDVRALAEGLLRKDEQIKAVKYFSAFATWKPDSFARHRTYVEALKSRGVDVILGQFKEKPRKCHQCKSIWMSHEEKETDVQIATHMVADALRGEVDRLILISADTDLAPPIKMIAQLAPNCEVFVATPPKRFKLCRALGPQLDIGISRLEAAQLPDRLQISAAEWIERPRSYHQPAEG